MSTPLTPNFQFTKRVYGRDHHSCPISVLLVPSGRSFRFSVPFSSDPAAPHHRPPPPPPARLTFGPPVVKSSCYALTKSLILDDGP